MRNCLRKVKKRKEEKRREKKSRCPEKSSPSSVESQNGHVVAHGHVVTPEGQACELACAKLAHDFATGLPKSSALWGLAPAYLNYQNLAQTLRCLAVLLHLVGGPLLNENVKHANGTQMSGWSWLILFCLLYLTIPFWKVSIMSIYVHIMICCQLLSCIQAAAHPHTPASEVLQGTGRKAWDWHGRLSAETQTGGQSQFAFDAACIVSPRAQSVISNEPCSARRRGSILMSQVYPLASVVDLKECQAERSNDPQGNQRPWGVAASLYLCILLPCYASHITPQCPLCH